MRERVIGQLPPLSIPDEVQSWLTSDGVRIIGVIVIGIAIRWFSRRTISQVVRGLTNPPESLRKPQDGPESPRQAAVSRRRVARIETLGSLLKSITTVTVATIAVLTILGILGIPLTPLLASAGIGGVILGIGAQNVVKDFLNGLFMLFEDQYGVGDEIDTGQASGTVRAVGLRVTRLVDDDGVTWFVRNGEITRIGNHSRTWAQAVVDMPVSYAEDPHKVIAVIKKSLEGITQEAPFDEMMTGKPDVVGVQSVSGSTMTIRVRARTLPGHNQAVARELRQRIKRALDDAGIQGPPVVAGEQ